MNHLRIIASDNKNGLIRQIKEILISRLEAEAELNALNKQETTFYINNKMKNVPNFSLFSEEELKRYLEDQLFTYKLVLKKIEDKRDCDEKLSL